MKTYLIKVKLSTLSTRPQTLSAFIGCGDDTMKVELNLPLQHPPHTLDKAVRLIFLLAFLEDLCEGGSRCDLESRLVDDLISRIQFWHDKVTRRTVN